MSIDPSCTSALSSSFPSIYPSHTPHNTPKGTPSPSTGTNVRSLACAQRLPAFAAVEPHGSWQPRPPLHTGYAGLKELLGQYLRKGDQLLMAGCGNSRLSEEMYEDGYTTIANIDISRVVIDHMAERCAAMEGMTCTYMRACVRTCVHECVFVDPVRSSSKECALLCIPNAIIRF